MMNPSCDAASPRSPGACTGCEKPLNSPAVGWVTTTFASANTAAPADRDVGGRPDRPSACRRSPAPLADVVAAVPARRQREAGHASPRPPPAARRGGTASVGSLMGFLLCRRGQARRSMRRHCRRRTRELPERTPVLSVRNCVASRPSWQPCASPVAVFAVAFFAVDLLRGRLLRRSPSSRWPSWRSPSSRSPSWPVAAVFAVAFVALAVVDGRLSRAAATGRDEPTGTARRPSSTGEELAGVAARMRPRPAPACPRRPRGRRLSRPPGPCRRSSRRS